MLITITNKNIDITDFNGLKHVKLAKNLSNENIDKFFSKNLYNLVSLNVQGVRQLTHIPTITNLEHLDCSGSNKLVTIEAQPSLIYLYCNSCKRLKNLPILPNLDSLECRSTPLNNWTISIKHHKWLYDLSLVDMILEYNPQEINNIFCSKLPTNLLVTYIHKNPEYINYLREDIYPTMARLFKDYGLQIPEQLLVKSACKA